jgi:hypothetical protein
VPAARLIYDLPWCTLSMASNEIGIPPSQPPSQQAAMTSHHQQRPTTRAAAAAMANQNKRATSSTPKWLLPINGRRKSSRLASRPSTTSTQTTSCSNLNPVPTQGRPSVPQRHEPEPSSSATAHQIISTSASMSPSPAHESGNSVACAAKRKAPDVASGDELEEQRDHFDPRHAAAGSKGGGGLRENGIWISQGERANIRMKATVASKNSRRRVTLELPGDESHSDPARMVANDSHHDGESSRFILPRNGRANNLPGQTQRPYFLGQERPEECRLDIRRESRLILRWTMSCQRKLTWALPGIAILA